MPSDFPEWYNAKEEKAMNDNDKNMSVPYIVYESMLDKEDRQQRRLVYVIIMLVVLLVVTNVIWLVAWNQYDYVDDYSVELDGGDGGNANYIGQDGEIYNGTSEGDSETE